MPKGTAVSIDDWLRRHGQEAFVDIMSTQPCEFDLSKLSDGKHSESCRSEPLQAVGADSGHFHVTAISMEADQSSATSSDLDAPGTSDISNGISVNRTPILQTCLPLRENMNAKTLLCTTNDIMDGIDVNKTPIPNTAAQKQAAVRKPWTQAEEERFLRALGHFGPKDVVHTDHVTGRVSVRLGAVSTCSHALNLANVR